LRYFLLKWSYCLVKKWKRTAKTPAHTDTRRLQAATAKTNAYTRRKNKKNSVHSILHFLQAGGFRFCITLANSFIKFVKLSAFVALWRINRHFVCCFLAVNVLVFITCAATAVNGICLHWLLHFPRIKCTINKNIYKRRSATRPSVFVISRRMSVWRARRVEEPQAAAAADQWKWNAKGRVRAEDSKRRRERERKSGRGPPYICCCHALWLIIELFFFVITYYYY